MSKTSELQQAVDALDGYIKSLPPAQQGKALIISNRLMEAANNGGQDVSKRLSLFTLEMHKIMTEMMEDIAARLKALEGVHDRSAA
jgi:hypothetical protein